MSVMEEKQVDIQRQQVKRLPIYAFLSGSAISYVGDILTILAVPWFVLQTTGSITQTGITAFFSTASTVFSSFLGSILVDGLGYKRTSVIGDIVSGITAALIPLLYNTVGLAFWQLLFLVFLGGLCKSPGVTARSAMTPDLAVKAHLRLERVNALSDGVRRISGFIGAPIAGVLIALIGTSNLLWFDAISFFMSALLIGLAVPATPVIAKEDDSPKSYITNLLAGVRFLRLDSAIFALVITVMVTNLLDSAYISVVGPAYMKHLFNSPVPFALMVAAFGGATFVSTLIFSIIGHRLPRRITLGAGFTTGIAIRYSVLLFLPILPVILIGYAIAGLFIGPINPIINTYMQERVPVEMRARVFGTVEAGVLAGVPVAAFMSGYIVTWIGLKETLMLMGSIYLLMTFSLLINPALRKM